MRWSVWSKKNPWGRLLSFFLGKKNVHIFMRFDCLLSSSLGAVKSLPDFNVKYHPCEMMEFLSTQGRPRLFLNVDGYFPSGVG